VTFYNSVRVFPIVVRSSQECHHGALATGQYGMGYIYTSGYLITPSDICRRVTTNIGKGFLSESNFPEEKNN
jgi:hypothetical protein